MPPTKKRKRRPPAKKAGRKSILTVDLTTKIKEQVCQGVKYVAIQKMLGIAPSTWDEWVTNNYQGFRENLTTWNHEHMLNLAERNMKDVLNLDTVEAVIGLFGPVIDKKTNKPVKRVNDKLLKIKSDMSTFIGETLGNTKYTKKIKTEDVSGPKKLIIIDDSTGEGTI